MSIRAPDVFRHLDRNRDYHLDEREIGAVSVRRFDQNGDRRVDSDELWRGLDRLELAGSEAERRISAALDSLQVAIDEPWRGRHEQEEAAERARGTAFQITAIAGGAGVLLALLCGFGVVAGIAFLVTCAGLGGIPPLAAHFARQAAAPDPDAARAELRAGLELAAAPGPLAPAIWPSDRP